MRAAKRLTLGTILASLGGAGIIFGPILNISGLGSPWSFILGFVFGVLAGTGTALLFFGIHEKKQGV